MVCSLNIPMHFTGIVYLSPRLEILRILKAYWRQEVLLVLFPSVTLIPLPFTWTLMDPGCACLQTYGAYGKFSSFCTHVADHLWKLFINHIPNSGFWNPSLQQSQMKANFFSGRFRQVLQEELNSIPSELISPLLFSLTTSLRLLLRSSVFLLLYVCTFSHQVVPTLCDPMDCGTLGLPVPHHLPEFAQVHVHWVSDAIQPSHPLSPPSPAFNLSHHQGLFQWVGSLYQVAKVLEFQLQHQSFQCVFRVDFL